VDAVQANFVKVLSDNREIEPYMKNLLYKAPPNDDLTLLVPFFDAAVDAVVKARKETEQSLQQTASAGKSTAQLPDPQSPIVREEPRETAESELRRLPSPGIVRLRRRSQ